jgi:glucosamine-6-phosphate deaminase
VNLQIFLSSNALAAAGAADAARILREAIAKNARARLVAATGASQLAFLAALVREPGVDWKKVELFHLDEYLGLPKAHKASFRAYLEERLIGPTGIERTHLIDGEGDPAGVIGALGAAIREAPIDLAFVGIGENGHVAFNDPPADFENDVPFLVVTLDEPCRRQQVAEGWFSTLDEVPKQAITMSVRQILRSRDIVCVVPDARKAKAVKAAVEGPLTPDVPASILQRHPRAKLYLDCDSAGLLDPYTATTAV